MSNRRHSTLLETKAHILCQVYWTSNLQNQFLVYERFWKPKQEEMAVVWVRFSDHMNLAPGHRHHQGPNWLCPPINGPPKHTCKHVVLESHHKAMQHVGNSATKLELKNWVDKAPLLRICVSTTTTQGMVGTGYPNHLVKFFLSIVKEQANSWAWAEHAPTKASPINDIHKESLHWVMSLIIWNIRGLFSRQRQVELKRILDEKRVEFIGILETKFSKWKFWIFSNLLGDDGS